MTRLKRFTPTIYEAFYQLSKGHDFVLDEAD